MEEKVVKEIDLDDILPNRFQPRIKFNEEALVELSNSIKEHGIIQPIIVREIGDKYEIIAGERRYKASVLAGMTTIPAIVNNLDDIKSSEIALIENVQRQDLTPIEEAISYKKILDLGNLTQEKLAEKIDKKQSTISNKLRLLNLADEVQEALLNEHISERHARSLLKLETESQQVEMLSKIKEDRLTVRQTDIEIEKITNPSNTTQQPEIQNESKEELEEISMDDIFEETISDSADYNFDEVKNNPGFLDIDEIEKRAQDLPKENPLEDLNPIKTEEEEKTETEAKQVKEEESKFFNFSPGELIEEEEKKEEVAIDLTGFEFKMDDNIEVKEESRLEKTQNEIGTLIKDLKNKGSKIDVEEIDLEDQYQIIIKIKKD